MAQQDMALTSTGQRIDTSKVRIKTGDDLIPKTTFQPLASPEKLHGLKYDNVDDLLANGKMVIYEDLVRIFAASKKPVTLWGPIGAGKTRSVQAFANETDENGIPYQVVTIQPSTTDPTSLHGLMTIKEDHITGKTITERAIPDPAEKVWKYFNDKDGLTVMFLDEMTTCTPAQQQALLGLLTHGQYGEMDISPYVTFVMAANPPGTVDGVLDLEQSVINRGAHIPWYVDQELFYKKWTTGFGNLAKAPDDEKVEFMMNLVETNPEIAFRDDPTHYEDPEEEMWNIDHMCPYDRMHFSARIFTEAADVYELINKTFVDANYSIRKLYIKEAITAFCGPNWGEGATIAIDKMEEQVKVEYSLRAVNKYAIHNMMSHESIISKVGDSLHINKGKKMRAEQEIELVEKFEKEIFKDGGFRQKLYLAFWVWASTIPIESNRKAVIVNIFNILNKATAQESAGLSQQDLLPKFVPVEIRQEIKELYTRSQDMSHS